MSVLERAGDRRPAPEAAASVVSGQAGRPGRRRGPLGELRDRPHAVKVFAAAFACLFLASAAWSFATPLLAAPDEPVHIVKAAAVVRGEFTGLDYYGNDDPRAVVNLPPFYAMIRTGALDPAHSLTCFHRDAGAIAASCAASVNTPPLRYEAPVTLGTALVAPATQAMIYNARYPPLYYALVGLPSLLGTSSADLYLMRLWSGALTCGFLALAFALAATHGRRRTLVIGLLVAVTPMVLFLGAVVNPSGLEISSAVATWTAGTLLFVARRDLRPPTGLVVAFGLSALVFELTRSLSPFWLALTVAALLVGARREALEPALRSRAFQVCAAIVLLGALGSVLWTVLEHATLVYTYQVKGAPPVGVPRSTAEITILETSFAHNAYYLPTMVGVFGWFDTYSPLFTYVAWYAIVGALVLVGAAVASRRERVLLGLIALGIVVIPVVISSSQAHRYGYVWSGRDTLPFAVGLPIVAAGIVSAVRAVPPVLTRGLGKGVVVLAFLAQFAAFFEALRRYQVGTSGPDFGFLLHPRWHAPLDDAALLLAYGVALIGLYALATWTLATRGGPLVLAPIGERVAPVPASDLEEAAEVPE